MALSLVGTDFRGTQDEKGVHRRNDRKVQDRGPCFESSRRHAANDQRWHYTSRSGSLLRPPRPFPPRSETRTGCRTNHPQYSSLLPEHDLPTHPTQVGRLLLGRCSARPSTGLAPQTRPLTQVQRPHSVPDVPSLRQGDALGIAECGTQSHGLGRSEGYQQAQETSSRPPAEGCLANTRHAGSALSNHRADFSLLWFANQRNPGFTVDGLRLQTIGGSNSAIGGGKATQQIEDGIFAGRGPARTGLHPRIEEMANALPRLRGRMAVSESNDRPTVSRRLNSCRLPGSNRSPVGTWQDRVPHVPPHLPCMAGRNRSTRGCPAETHATRARFHHNGPIWKCLGLGKTQSQ